MSYTPVTIPGFEQGLVQNMDPHLIPDDAQPDMLNAYQWRKRLIKKGGCKLFGNTGRLGDRLQVITGAPPVLPANIGATAYFGVTPLPIMPGTVNYFDGVTTYTDTPTNSTTGVLTGVAGSSINYVNGAIAGWPAPAAGTITISWIRQVDQYSPVMGLCLREMPAINNEELIAFDRQAAYSFNSTTLVFDQLLFFRGGTDPCFWRGTNYNFFQYCNYANAIWVTNGTYGYYASQVQITAAVGEGGDPIRWYDGTGWNNFNPPLGPPVGGVTQYLLGAKFIIPFKNRLLCFNTTEGPNITAGVSYTNRCRFSSLANPYYGNYAAPFTGALATGWYSTPGAGGYIDLPTQEAITSVTFLKDYLIIFCERSTWALSFTNNSNTPFIFTKINTEFGCESPNSIVNFDKEILAVSNNGIIGADTNNVERMDQKIPDLSYTFHNDNQGILRVHGVKNYMPQMVLWTYRDSADTIPTGQSFTPTFPNRILVFNYQEDSFSIFQQSFTTFANFQTYLDGTWATSTFPWITANQTWNSAVNQTLNPTTVAGNQQGCVFITSLVGDDPYQGNDYSLVIEGIATVGADVLITSPQHNLEPGQYLYLNNINGTVEFNQSVFKVGDIITDNTFSILTFDGPAWIPPTGFTAYTWGGTIKILDNFNITTKKYNQFIPNARAVRLGYLDFLVQSVESSTTLPELQVDMFVDNDDLTTPTITTNIDTEGKPNDVLVWKRTFPQSVGSFYTFILSHPEILMRSTDPDTFDPICEVPFELHSMQMWAAPSGRMVR